MIRRGAVRVINALGIIGAVAVGVLLVAGKSPERMLVASMAPTPAGPVSCDDPRAPELGCVTTGKVVAVPTWATSFKLAIRYPGGYESSAAGAVAFFTNTPSPRPTLTPTPCLDSENPYGVPYGRYGLCVDCEGHFLPNSYIGLDGRCWPTTPTTPTATRTRTPSPSPRPTTPAASTPTVTPSPSPECPVYVVVTATRPPVTIPFR